MKSTRWLFLLCTLFCALCVTFASSGEAAGLSFTDSFAYSLGPLSGDGPPNGAPPGQTAWSSLGGNPQVTAPGLRLKGVTSAGEATTITGVVGANGDIAQAGTPVINSGKVWIGFLVRLAAGKNISQGFSVLYLGGGSSGPSFGLVFDSGFYGIDNNTGLAGSTALTSVVPSRDPVWLVVELDFTFGMEYLYVNPTKTSQPAAQLPMTSGFKAGGFTVLGLAGGFNTASFNYDEIRIGGSLKEIQK